MSKYSTYTSTSQRSILKDNSWIKTPDDEDEAVDRDPNFGKSVLGGRYTQTTTSESYSAVNQPRTSTSSVEALTKRFSTSQEELPTSPTSYSWKTSISDRPQTSSTTTTITENGKTTVTTTTKSSTKTDSFMDRVFSDKTKGTLYSSYSPTRKTVTETSITSTSNNAEDKLYDTLLNDPIRDGIDSKTSVTKSETVIVKSSDDTAEDKLFDTLIPSSIMDESKTITTEIVTVKSSSEPDDIKTTSTTRTSTSSMAEDQLYDTLIPKAISNQSPTSSSITRRSYTVSSSGPDSPTLSSTTRTSSYSSYTDDYSPSRTSTYTITSKTTSDEISSDTKTYTYSKPDSNYESYSSITSPSSYSSTTYKTTRSDETLGDTYSRSSVTSVYASPERTVLEKDLCSYCRKPFTGDAKMILDDMKINCHANCFKCEVCNSNLGYLKAGDSMWIYKRMVHCDRCFEVTRDKWRR